MPRQEGLEAKETKSVKVREEVRDTARGVSHMP